MANKEVLKVLIAEDDLILLELLAQIIEELGYEVLRANNGKEALNIIEKEQPHLVISDVMMPILDGYELLRQVRLHPRFGNIKVALISAVPIDKRRPPGADAYVQKPYNLEDIEGLINQLSAL